MIRERQRAGIALAKERGVYKGRKPSPTPDKVKVIWQWRDAGESIAVSLEP